MHPGTHTCIMGSMPLSRAAGCRTSQTQIGHLSCLFWDGTSAGAGTAAAAAAVGSAAAAAAAGAAADGTAGLTEVPAARTHAPAVD